MGIWVFAHTTFMCGNLEGSKQSFTVLSFDGAYIDLTDGGYVANGMMQTFHPIPSHGQRVDK
jgi:hypothetical protein